MTAVPQLQFTESGLIVPTSAAVLDGEITDINDAFGGGVNPSLETPQGQLASSIAASINDKNAAIAYLVNQVDPLYSSGKFQDGIGRIYFLDRKPALPTVVQCTVIGIFGTVIPVGALARDTSGNNYVCSGEVTIGISGQVEAEFSNVLTGPMPCPENTLTIVGQAIPGWDAISNDAAGVLGANVESRAEFENRRKNSVALNAHGTPPSIYANVFAVDGVIDAYVIDNPLSTVVLTGSTDYPVAAHSIYVAVVGGDDTDVASAIWNKKDAGCDYNGNTEVTIRDESGYSYPQPSYQVKFERPSTLPILFAVRIVNKAGLPANTDDLIKQAIIARFNGVDGSLRERIGSTILSSRYYAPVSLVPEIELIDILVGSITPTLTQVNVGIDQRPTIDESDISVTRV